MAVSLDGTNDYLTLSRMQAIEGGGTLSIGGWFYHTADRDHWCVAKHDDTDYAVLLYRDDVCATGYQGADNTDTWVFLCGQHTVAADRINGPTNAAVLNTWQHVVGVMSGAVRVLYVNGVQVAQHSAASSTTVPAQDYDFWLGAWEYVPDRRLAGVMGDVFITTEALSGAEVASIYKHQRLMYQHVGAAECYLPLMGPTGVAVATTHWGCKDLSGNGNSVSAEVGASVWADDPFPPQSWTDGPFGGAWVAAAAGGVNVELAVAVAEAIGLPISPLGVAALQAATAQATAAALPISVPAIEAVALAVAQGTASGLPISVPGIAAVELAVATATAAGLPVAITTPSAVVLEVATATATGLPITPGQIEAVALEVAQATAAGLPVVAIGVGAVELAVAQATARGIPILLAALIPPIGCVGPATRLGPRASGRAQRSLEISGPATRLGPRSEPD